MDNDNNVRLNLEVTNTTTLEDLRSYLDKHSDEVQFKLSDITSEEKAAFSRGFAPGQLASVAIEIAKNPEVVAAFLTLLAAWINLKAARVILRKVTTPTAIEITEHIAEIQTQAVVNFIMK